MKEKIVIALIGITSAVAVISVILSMHSKKKPDMIINDAVENAPEQEPQGEEEVDIATAVAQVNETKNTVNSSITDRHKAATEEIAAAAKKIFEEDDTPVVTKNDEKFKKMLDQLNNM